MHDYFSHSDRQKNDQENSSKILPDNQFPPIPINSHQFPSLSLLGGDLNAHFEHFFPPLLALLVVNSNYVIKSKKKECINTSLINYLLEECLSNLYSYFLCYMIFIFLPSFKIFFLHCIFHVVIFQLIGFTLMHLLCGVF